jgi:23S rRNA (uracil1939-C5)-methyltransferase
MKNTQHSTIIDRLSDKGTGVATISNKPIYIPNTIPGETVTIKIIKETRTFGIGKLLSIDKPSKDRVTEACNIAATCGGCQLQHIDYQKQLEFKRNLLTSLGTIETIPCLAPLETRNKVQFAVSRVKDDIHIGLYQSHSNRVIDTETCPVQSPLINTLFQSIKSFIKDYNPSIYNPSTGEGLLRHIVIRSSDHAKQGMIAFVCTKRGPLFEKKVQEYFSKNPLVGSLLLNINSQLGDTILGKETILLSGNDILIESIAGNLFYFNLNTFIQSNRIQTQTLYETIKSVGNFKKDESVVDVYCGVGTITQYIAPFVKSIIGIEENADSVSLATKSLSLGNNNNIFFLKGKAESCLNSIEKTAIDTIILDPPRKGCHIDLLNFIKQKKIKKIIYISCNPVSLKNDLEILKDTYKWDTIHAVDMFPQTIHIESVTCLSVSS